MSVNVVMLKCPSCKENLQIENDFLPSRFTCSFCRRDHAIVREHGNIIALAPGLRSVEYRFGEKNENMQSLLEHIERALPLDQWKFQQSAKFFAKGSPRSKDYETGNDGYYPVVIYDSSKCRVLFTLDYSGFGRSYASFIYYGRLHAPNDISIMKWENEDCYCWNSIEDATLPFLDEVSPSAAVDKGRKHLWGLPDPSEFAQSSTEHIQYPLKLHAAIWNDYGNRLFDLFDLSNADLWSRYRQYLKEYYNIRARSSHHTPGFDKAC